MKYLIVLFVLSVAAPQDYDQKRKELIESEVKSAIERLKNGEHIERAFLILSQLGEYSLDPLVELFKESVPATPQEDSAKLAQTRILVCSILTDIGKSNDDVIELLLGACEDFGGTFENTVAASAINALGNIGLPYASKVIPVLYSLLDHEKTQKDKVLKAEIIKALGNLRAFEAEEKLIMMLEPSLKNKETTGDDRLSHSITALIIESLEQIRSEKAVRELIKEEYIEEDSFKDPFEDRPISYFTAKALATITGEDKGSFDDFAEVDATVNKWKKWAKEKREEIALRERKKRVAENTALTKEIIGKLVDAIEEYRAQNQKLPEKLDDLKYEGELKDAWGNELHYNVPGTGADYDLLSYGDDGKEGGSGLDADIWNHDNWKEAKITGTKEVLTAIKTAIQEYKKDTGNLPNKLEDLFNKPEGIENWREGGYLAEQYRDLKDLFGNKLVYKLTNREDAPFELISYGNDRKEGGEEDVDADIIVK